MSRCPRCSKKFADLSRVMNHMNQHGSTCLSYYEEINSLAAGRNWHLSPDNLQDVASNPVGNHSNTLHRSPSSSDGPRPLATMDSGFDIPAIAVNDLPLDATIDSCSMMDIDSTPSMLPFVEKFPGAAQTFGRAPTFMDLFDADLHADKRKRHPYYPFASKEEWQLASFLLCSDLSMNAIDKFLKLELVSKLQT